MSRRAVPAVSTFVPNLATIRRYFEAGGMAAEAALEDFLGMTVG
jgi:hypothetical protein